MRIQPQQVCALVCQFCLLPSCVAILELLLPAQAVAGTNRSYPRSDGHDFAGVVSESFGMANSSDVSESDHVSYYSVQQQMPDKCFVRQCAQVRDQTMSKPQLDRQRRKSGCKDGREEESPAESQVGLFSVG